MSTNYKQILNELPYLIENLEYDISILSNASALLNLYMDNINWVGFYIAKNNKLILGPFQGKPACVEIPYNKGVCGHCATTRETIIVENVHTFKGHIACDSQSNSEICIPMFKNNEFYGLLDIDSPSFSRFNEDDKLNLENTVKVIEKALTFSK